MLLITPDYYDDFKCKASACTDNCCIGWEIDIDEDTFGYYKSLEGEFAEKFSKDNADYTFTSSGNAPVTVRLDKLTNKDYNVGTGLGTAENPEADPNGESPYTIYYKWLVALEYLPAEE